MNLKGEGRFGMGIASCLFLCILYSWERAVSSQIKTPVVSYICYMSTCLPLGLGERGVVVLFVGLSWLELGILGYSVQFTYQLRRDLGDESGMILPVWEDDTSW